MSLGELEAKNMAELYKIGRELEIPRYYQMLKKELILEISKAKTEKDGLLYAKGTVTRRFWVFTASRLFTQYGRYVCIPFTNQEV